MTRSSNNRLLRLLSVLGCALALVLLGVLPALAGFTTNKTATPVVNTCSSYQVQLSITGSNPPQKAIDAVIVIDRSGSMAGDSIVNAKIAAKQFAASVLTNPNSRVALVSYSSTATVNQTLTNSLSTIETKINALSAGGTTNVKDGFDKARGEMQTRGRSCTDVNRVIVFLTDGVANEGAGSCTAWPTAHTPCTIAGYLAGQAAQESGLTTVFTIGLLGGVSSTHPESLAVARDTMQKAQNGGYFETLSAPDLTGIFQAIFQQLNFVIKNAVVTDSISGNFVLNPASLNSSKGATSLVGSVITWNIGLVGNETVTLSYTIDPAANISGASLPTNQSASVAYSDPYCIAGTSFFPNPTVEVHPCCSVAAQPAGGSFNLSTVVTGGKAPLTYSWSDQGEGGTWNPDANVANPTWNPPVGWDGIATLALTVTDANNMQSNCSVMVMAVSGSLQGQVWFDNNGDGSQAGGDLGLSGVVVQLYDAGNNLLETTATDGSGNYVFSNLSPGTYTVVVIPDPRWQITHDPSGIPPLQSTWTGALSGGQVINNLEFGYTRLDFSDAPDSFGTLTVSNGPRHTVIDGGIFLGASIDSEVDGIPNASATGDDISNLADEDGVTFPMPLARGFNATIKVTASAAGSLDAWIDFNQNGSFSDAGEQIFNAQGLSAGVNTLTLSVPIGAIAGDTYSRFRFSSSGGLAPTGWAPDGEVEDYLIPIYDPGSISGYVWTDLNGDGIWQDSEPAVSGATVNLYARQNPAEPADDTLNPYVIVNTTVSGMDGLYSFNDLLPVHYIVEVILPDGYTGFTIQNNPAAPDCRDSHVDPATGQTGKMRITSGRIITCVNAGLVPANPSLSVTKTATETAVAVGQTIHYTISITNTGNVTLTNVTFTDTKLPPPPIPITINLGPGETVNIQLEYIVQPEDLPGPVVNTVIVDSDQTDAVSATESVNIIALSLTKTAQESTVRVGETIHYFITVKNEGSATLTNVAVNDPVLGFSQIIASLAAGDSQTFTPTYTVEVSDLPGPINNTASADSDQTSPLTAGATVDIAGLTLNKSVAETIANVGQTVHYTIEVSNIGSADLNNVIVSDPKIGFSTVIASLPAGTSQTFNPTYVVQAGDLPGPLLNTASAYTPQTGEVTDQTSVDLAALSLTKSALESAVKVGDTIHYSLTVKNEGNVTLTNINITDPKLGINSTIPGLDPGSSQTISGSYQVTDADLPGPVVNTATADSDQTDPVTANASVAIAALTVSKNATETVAGVGGTVHYTIMVSNSGSADLTNVTVNDPKLGFSQTLSLAAGASQTFNPTYVVQASDLPGPLVNTVTADSDQTEPVSAQDSVDLAALSLIKTAVETVVKVGDTIHYTLTVKNEGNVALINILITDPKLGINTITSLPPGSHYTIPGSYLVTSADLPGPVLNTATADCDQTDPVTANASVAIAALTVSKNATETVAGVGGTVHYTIVVSNTGSADLTNVTVNDPKLGFSQILSLAAGTSQTFNPTYVVQTSDLPGPLVNTVTADSDQTEPVSAQDSVDLAALSLIKASDKQAAKVGETINYTITVTNTGNIDLHNVTVQDSMLGLNEVIPTLPWGPPTNTVVYSRSYTVQESHLPGPIVNTAIADSDETEQINDSAAVGIYALSIDKSAPAGPFKLGQTVPYQIKVWNAGSAELTNVVLSDAKLGIVNQLIGTLPVTNNAANPIVISAFYGPVSEADLGPNPIHNTATADSDQTDPAVSDSCDVPVAAVKISKTGPATMTIGQTIQYTITVQNLGSAVLTNVLVQDPRIGINWSIPQLAVGATLQQQFPYVVKAEDLPGPIHNNATVTTAQTDPGSDTWVTPLDPAPRGKMVGSGTIKTGTSFQVDVVSWPGATAPQGNLVYKDISRGISLTGTASYVAINPQTKEVVYGGPVSGTPRNAATFKVYVQDGGSKDTFKIWLYDKNGTIIYSAGGPVLIGQLVFRESL